MVCTQRVTSRETFRRFASSDVKKRFGGVVVSQVSLHATESGGQSEIFEQAKFVKDNPISDSPTSYLPGIERSKCPEFAYSI